MAMYILSLMIVVGGHKVEDAKVIRMYGMTNYNDKRGAI